ncbi:hypothetical protein SUGI_0014490 [Cryptomeria japonica]|nr:hypothetical protein SUGI_0014490 [Cryptomeria japonica]
MKNTGKIVLFVMCITLILIKGSPLNNVNTEITAILNTGGTFAAEAPPPLPQITGLAFLYDMCTTPTDPNPQITEFCTCIQLQCPLGFCMLQGKIFLE